MNKTASCQRWQRQLIYEHQQLCAYYRVKLPTPLLVISEGKSKAGAWQALPAPGVLQIAAWLIREHSWDVVLEVLKHELSHQLVDHEQAARGSRDESPHGPAFQEACRRLGVHPHFRQAKSQIPRLLPEWSKRPRQAGQIEESPATSHSPVAVKIEKLLALVSSANEHESALAMVKAGELMRRHNLKRLAANSARAFNQANCSRSTVAKDYDYLLINTGRLRRLPHQRYLAALLQSFFYVKTISYPLYEPLNHRKSQVLELLGSKENLAVAEYVYHFLEGQLPRLWRRYQQMGQAPGKEKNSYYIGVLNGFREKLQQQERANGKGDLALAKNLALAAGGALAPVNLTCSSLVCSGDRGLQDFLNTRFPHVRAVYGKGSRLYRATYQAGRAEGHKIVIHKGIHHQEGNQGLLLG